MKSGGFDAITEQFSLEKLHQHSHLYTSENLVDFPGRVFEIESSFEYNKQHMKTHLENKKGQYHHAQFPGNGRKYPQEMENKGWRKSVLFFYN